MFHHATLALNEKVLKMCHVLLPDKDQTVGYNSLLVVFANELECG